MNVTSAAPKVTPHVNVAATPASLGSNALVGAVAGVKYRVLQCSVVSTLANVVTFKSNTTSISGAYPLAANGGIVLPYNEHGWFETAAGEALNVDLSVATATAITLQYIRILP